MEFTQIPNIEQKASRVALGTWSIGGWLWGGSDDKDSIKTILRALEKGINVIDTAPVYGFGHAEKLVGKALKEFGSRDNVIIATKAGINWENQKPFRDCSKNRLQQEIEDSLKRLDVEAIDLYQIHWPDPNTPIEEAAEFMKGLLDQGKIRAVGVSNFSPEEMDIFRQISPLHSCQPPYNLFEREIEESALFYCLKNRIAVLGYGALCRGLLSGKMSKDRSFEGDDLRQKDPKFQEPRFSEYLEAACRLEEWAEKKHGRPLIAVAVRWMLDKRVNIALWGARKPKQIDDVDSVWGWKLKEDDFAEIDHIIFETIKQPVGPEFMAPPS